MVFKFLGCLVKEKITKKFLLACLNTHANSKGCSESAKEFLFWLSFTVIGRFSTVYERALHSRLSDNFLNHMRLSKKLAELQAATWNLDQASWSRLLEGFSQLVSDFISAQTKVVICTFKTIYLSHDTISLIVEFRWLPWWTFIGIYLAWFLVILASSRCFSDSLVRITVYQLSQILPVPEF